MLTRSSTSCLKMGARTSSCSSRKCVGFVSRLERSSSNSPCCCNLKHPSKSVVSLASRRRYTRTIPRFDQTVRICRIPGRHELSVPGRLCRPRKTVNRDDLPHARLQNKKPLELLHAQRQPRVLQHQPHLRLLRLMYLSNHSGKRKYNIKLWKTFSDVFNVMPVCALID